MPDLAVNSQPAVTYVEVALPLPLRQTFTYKVPFSVQRAIQLGDRVLVPFGKRHLTGYSVALHDELPKDIDIDESAIKEIVQLLDSEPIINSEILRLTKWTARASGHSSTFILAVSTILIWAVTGPIFGFSNTWQLVINTGTTIVTFLMVFLIQSTQNRDAEAMQIKLDEIIRSIEGAKNELLDLEELEDEDLAQARDVYEKLAAEARKALRSRTRRPGPGSTG